MIDDHTVISLNLFYNKIEIIELKTKKFLEIQHQFVYETWDHAFGVEVFSQSRTFCVWERAGWGKNHLRLTYYHYEDLKEGLVPVADWTASSEEWDYNCQLTKMNNHSMMGWWRCHKYYETIMFRYFDLRDDPKGKFTSVKISYGDEIKM